MLDVLKDMGKVKLRSVKRWGLTTHSLAGTPPHH